MLGSRPSRLGSLIDPPLWRRRDGLRRRLCRTGQARPPDAVLLDNPSHLPLDLGLEPSWQRVLDSREDVDEEDALRRGRTLEERALRERQSRFRDA
jgi:hypothetical protein